MVRRRFVGNDVERVQRKIKRQRRNDDLARMVDPSKRPVQTAGGVNGLTFMSGRTSLSLGRPMSSLEVLMAKMKIKETSIISRFQGLTPTLYTDNVTTANQKGYFPLCKKWADVGNSTDMNMPVYCFNLTASPHIEGFGTTNPTWASLPFYRLQKKVYATGVNDAANINYSWIAVNGKGADGTTDTGGWTPEKVQNLTTANLLEFNGQYLHRWTAVDLSLVNSSATAPHRIHIAVVSFKNIGAAPKRQYYNGAVISFDANATQDDRNRADLFYDSFLSRKTIHPNRSIVSMMENNKNLKFHSYECICLDNTVRDHASIFSKRMFFKDNKLYKCLDPNTEEKLHNPTINTGTVANYNQMWDVPPAATGITSTASCFPHWMQDRWLMIWTEDFNTPALYGESSRSDVTSFDLIARTKCSYSVL